MKPWISCAFSHHQQAIRQGGRKVNERKVGNSDDISKFYSSFIIKKENVQKCICDLLNHKFEKIYSRSFASIPALLTWPQQKIKGNLIRE